MQKFGHPLVRKNIKLTITPPLQPKAASAIEKVVHFSLLREAQKEVGVGR